MANQFCNERTPCQGLVDLLGRYVFATEDGGFAITVQELSARKKSAQAVTAVAIYYCPICGCHLSKTVKASSKQAIV